MALIPAGSGPRAWSTAAAVAVWLGAAGAAEAQSTIDAEQLCKRTGRVRDAIVEAIAGATATCIDADPGATPPVTAHYETNITESQLAGIETLDLKRRFPEPHPLSGDFRPGDFDGLSGLRELWLYDSWQPRRRLGLAAMGVPADVLGRLEGLIYSNCGVSHFQSVDFFEGLSNLQELEIGLNNLTHELPGNPNRPEATLVARIDPAVWQHLPNLRKLAIGRNRILTLPRGFFSHLTALEELDMYDMWYEYHPYGFGSQALPGGIFEGLSNLRRLNLGYNALGQTEVDDGLFDGLTSLQDLDLRDNPLLTVLPRSVLNLPAGVTIRTDPGVEWPTADNQPATGKPVIIGPPRVGETLTVSTDAIGDADGMSNATFSYQWIRNDTGTATDIGTATGPAYTLRAADAGKTLAVRVSFDDDSGNRESVTSNATAAVEANRSPEAVGALPLLSLAVEDGTSSVDVSGAFTDPDADALTYGATSSVVTVATVAVAGSVVTVTPLSRGSTTVSVTATDVDGSNTSATQEFAVTVTGGPDSGGGGGGHGGGGGGGRSNRGPEAVGTLEDRTLEVGAQPLSVHVSPAFRDREGDVLTYAAESSAAAVATVAVSAEVVMVAPLSRGAAEVTVTATDAGGSNRTATQAFTVTVAFDVDGDGLIGIHTLAQLDAVRHDLDGDGAAAAAGYAAAFGVTADGGRVVCAGGCLGYELGSDLDFDTNGSGGPDADDAYWHGGAGWLPLGRRPKPSRGRSRATAGAFATCSSLGATRRGCSGQRAPRAPFIT